MRRNEEANSPSLELDAIVGAEFRSGHWEIRALSFSSIYHVVRCELLRMDIPPL
jgi:hypothetical protein